MLGKCETGWGVAAERVIAAMKCVSDGFGEDLHHGDRL